LKEKVLLPKTFVSADHRSDVPMVVNFFQIWVFSWYLKAVYFPFSCLFALFVVEFLKSKIVGLLTGARGIYQIFLFVLYYKQE
jgi:hypothetical protein